MDFVANPTRVTFSGLAHRSGFLALSPLATYVITLFCLGSGSNIGSSLSVSALPPKFLLLESSVQRFRLGLSAGPFSRTREALLLRRRNVLKNFSDFLTTHGGA